MQDLSQKEKPGAGVGCKLACTLRARLECGWWHQRELQQPPCSCHEQDSTERVRSRCPFGRTDPKAKPTNSSRAAPHSGSQHQHLCNSYTSSEKPRIHQGAWGCRIPVLNTSLSTRGGTEQTSLTREYLYATEQSKGYYSLSRQTEEIRLFQVFSAMR